MRKILLTLAFPVFLAACSHVEVLQQNGFVAPSDVQSINTSDEIINLPGIQAFFSESQLINQGLGALSVIGCAPEDSGPFLRLQSSDFKKSNTNYMQFDVYLPDPQVIAADGVNWGEFLYGGATVNVNGSPVGDFDAMVATGTASPIGWKPSLSAKIGMKPAPITTIGSGYSAEFNKSISGENYAMPVLSISPQDRL